MSSLIKCYASKDSLSPCWSCHILSFTRIKKTTVKKNWIMSYRKARQEQWWQLELFFCVIHPGVAGVNRCLRFAVCLQTCHSYYLYTSCLVFLFYIYLTLTLLFLAHACPHQPLYFLLSLKPSQWYSNWPQFHFHFGLSEINVWRVSSCCRKMSTPTPALPSPSPK